MSRMFNGMAMRSTYQKMEALLPPWREAGAESIDRKAAGSVVKWLIGLCGTRSLGQFPMFIQPWGWTQASPFPASDPKRGPDSVGRYDRKADLVVALHLGLADANTRRLPAEEAPTEPPDGLLRVDEVECDPRGWLARTFRPRPEIRHWRGSLRFYGASGGRPDVLVVQMPVAGEAEAVASTLVFAGDFSRAMDLLFKTPPNPWNKADTDTRPTPGAEAANVCHEGPWYWIWKAPRWRIRCAATDIPHTQQWRTLADELVGYYGVTLSASDREDLYDAYRGMPRGRVGRIAGGAGGFTLAFNELPEGLSWPDQRQRLITEFALHDFRDRLRDQYVDDHETMESEHVATLERLLKTTIPPCASFTSSPAATL